MSEPREHADGTEEIRQAALQTSSAILRLQRRAEEELRQAKRALEERSDELARSLSLLEATLQSTPYGIVAEDLHRQVISHNARFVELWRIPEELIARRDGAELDRWVGSQVMDQEAFLRRVAEERDDPERETFWVIELHDGRVMERVAFPHRLDGKCIGVVFNWHDITERRELEATLRQSQKMEAVGTLAAGIAHDFNNLLTVITSYTELVASGLPADLPEQDDLQQIRAAGERAASLTRQLLTFAQRQPMDVREVDLGALVRDMERMLRRVLGSDVEIVTQIEPGRWSIRGDPGQLEQILLNLAINARDAMPAGGRLVLAVRNRTGTRGTVSDAEASADWVELSVSDSGSGMAPEVLEHAFEPFFTTKPKGSGTGLGLATVYGIVQRHQGVVETESVVGRGTTFRLRFPRADGSARALARRDGGSPAGRGVRILVVDDDPAVLTSTARVLRAVGHEVLEADDPRRALALVADGRPIDLLLTDHTMPGMSGPELAARVRALTPGVPVVLMSGYAEASRRSTGAHEAIDVFLAKPFTRGSLEEHIRRALEEKRANA